MTTTAAGDDDPDDFNFFAGIDAYNAAKEAADRMRDYTSGPQFHADAMKAAQSMGERMREYTSSAQNQIDAMEAARAAIQRMRQQAGALDSFTRSNARLAVRANEDWLEAEQKKSKGEKPDPSISDELGHAADHTEQVVPALTEDQVRILEMLGSLQGIHKQSAASARSLKAIHDAHLLAERRQALADRRQVLADNRQKSQERVNFRFAMFGAGLAIISLIAAVGMPLVEHFIWDAEKEKREAARDAAAAATGETKLPTAPSAQTPQPSAPSVDCRPDLPPALFLSCLVPQQTASNGR